MKTRVKKIMMIAAILIFVGSGVSFAHDWNDRGPKPPAKAYGHYKVQKQHPGWNTKPLKSKRQIHQKYVYKEARGHRYYIGHPRRPAPRKTVVYKPAKKDPMVVFKIILRDLR